MPPVRIITAFVFAAAVAVTGCTTHSSADHPSAVSPTAQPIPVPPATDPTHTSQPASHPTDPTPVDRQAPIYAAVLRQYLTSGDNSFGDHRFPRIFVLDRAVAGGAPMVRVSGGAPIPPAVQRAITHALADVGSLTFVASGDAVIVDRNHCARVRDEGILVTLGPVDGVGDRVEVGVNGFVACLGANSLTYVVERTGRGWVVGGITARGPVA
jgi:hypothetical protein